MYVLSVVLKNIIPVDEYDINLTLHVAIVILIDPILSKSHTSIAQKLLEHFVPTFGELYGNKHIVYNVHSLDHLVDDVNKLGSLDNFSAFHFESYMYKIERMITGNKHCLIQLCNRLE